MKGSRTEADLALFQKAAEEFRRTGKCGVHCNVCGTPIQFVEKGTATLHNCKCGKFTGTLRGL